MNIVPLHTWDFPFLMLKLSTLLFTPPTYHLSSGITKGKCNFMYMTLSLVLLCLFISIDTVSSTLWCHYFHFKQSIFIDIRTRKKCTFFLCLTAYFQFLLPFLLLDIWVSFWYHFLLALGILFRIFSIAGRVVTNSLTFCLSEDFFIKPSFLKDVPVYIECWQTDSTTAPML